MVSTASSSSASTACLRSGVFSAKSFRSRSNEPRKVITSTFSPFGPDDTHLLADDDVSRALPDRDLRGRCGVSPVRLALPRSSLRSGLADLRAGVPRRRLAFSLGSFSGTV